MASDLVLDLINAVRQEAGEPVVSSVLDSDRLRIDLGFDSLELAILSVKVEAACGIDVFENGVVETVGDIRSQIE